VGAEVALERVDTQAPAWVENLTAPGDAREGAVRELHALLLRATRHEVRRRRSLLPRAGEEDIDGLAMQAADDATVAVLDRLHTFEGRSRFTTWAYKFAILHASVTVRRTAWQEREIPTEPEAWPWADAHPGPEHYAEASHLAGVVRKAVEDRLTPHQRAVFIALAVNAVPVDVMAERLATTRGALYKTLHDARNRLRAALVESGFDVPSTGDNMGGGQHV
jgi:RNA polymerase sigma-70 factor (ECF subfamily)